MSEEKLYVDPEFFDLEMYAIYRAIYDLLGEETWKIVWRSGEILYNEIKDRIGAAGEKDPFNVLKKVANWLKEVGYIKEIEVNKASEDEVEYIMSDPIIARGARRLISEGRVPPHVSTALMFAALKDFNIRAEIVGEPRFLPDGRVVERWKLIKSAGR